MRAKLMLYTVLVMVAPASAGPPELPLDTTIDNFYHRGTQPGGLTNLIQPSGNCRNCHDTSPSIYMGWVGSLMGQAARDPLTYACLDIAEADAPGIGDTCLRCHAPKAWLEGRSTPTDGSALTVADRDGVNCHVCHRMVDPFSYPGAPSPDPAILAALGADAPIQSMDLGIPSMPGDGGNAGYVIDPLDQRRGPFPLPEFPGSAMPPEV
ncbi:MAG: multiheme c-type cytochrome, partial [Planctomycetota bacterium]|nr:multiheme c-type cytochrome [Planctomycetota bacterium]